ncbi:MAG: hypothetical protein HKN20_01640 [Gemmatimonadetes bacterium]|nr:hypothetical protein [Gemmatimonadota bacterium]
MEASSPVLCSYCGASLDALETHFGDVCFGETCIKRRAEQDWGAVRDRAAGTDGVSDPETFPATPIPAQQRKIAPLPAERAALFRAHLEKTIAEALTLESEGASFHEAEPESSWYAPALGEWLGAICASCEGYCCEAGGDTAFISTDTIRRIIRREPGLTAAAIAARYIERLPAESYEGACVFQGPAGCTLPREDRANICNVYLCKGLKTAKWNWEETGVRRAFLGRMSTNGLESYSFLAMDESE